MGKSPKSSCLRIFIFILIGGMCLGVVGIAWLFEALPGIVAKDFGMPGTDLDRLQRVIYGVQLLSVRQQVLEPVNPQGVKKEFKIEKDQTVTRIALNLENAGLVRDATAFRLYLIYAGLDTKIKAGSYLLSPAQNCIEIARVMQNAVSAEVTFRILPGWRMEEIAASLPTSGLKVTPEQFLAEARQPSPESIPAYLEKIKSFEGFFFPDTYLLRREITAQELVAALLKRFDEKVDWDLRNGFQRKGLDLPQAVILASIVQREAVLVEEQPMIASVFFNRLNIKMKLDSDPTVQYAVGYNQSQGTWWTNPISASQLKINSPYNTYIASGLPPGAISNPGLEALQAVAFPAQSPYFYFRAKCDGSRKHTFAVTYDEHLKNGCP